MTTISRPNTTINIIAADTTVANTAQKVLFVGQKLAAGTATSGTLVTDIQNDNSWDTLFGAGSMLAGMIRAARRENGITRFDAIPLDDAGAAVKSQGIITFTGTSTEAGTFLFNVISAKDYVFSVSVAVGDTATVIAGKLQALIALNTNIPIIPTLNVGAVELDAQNGGTEANSFAISFSGTVAGVTVALTAFTAGATDPDTSNIFDVVGGLRYQTIVAPFAYGTTYLTDFLDPRFNVTNNVLDGVALTCAIDSLANLKTLGNAQNSQSLNIIGDNVVSSSVHVGSSFIEAPYVRSSMIGSIRSLRLTDGADISGLVVTNSALDSFGGPAIASLPYFNTPLNNMVVTDSSLGFTDVQITDLSNSGISVLGNNVANNGVIIGEMVTTYKTDSAGNPDDSFKYLNYVDTSSNAREFMFNNAKSDFSQSRLTEGDLIPFRSINNADSIAAKFVGYYATLSGNEFVLTQASNEALSFYKSNLVVTVDVESGQATVIQKVPLVTQMRSIISTFQLVFNF